MVNGCTKCNFTTTETGSLRNHFCGNKILNGTIKKVCKVCSIESVSSLWKYLHQIQCRQIKRKMSSNIMHKKIECGKCMSKFKDMSKWIVHMKKVHTRKKHFLCDQCGFKTYSTKDIKHHMSFEHSITKSVLSLRKLDQYKSNSCNVKTNKQSSIIEKVNKRDSYIHINWIQCIKCLPKIRHFSDLESQVVCQQFVQNAKFKCKSCSFDSLNKYTFKNGLKNFKKNLKTYKLGHTY